MTNSKGFFAPQSASGQFPSRLKVCERCGTEFSCALEGPCWCAEETARLPMPTDGGDCLCRDCLRRAAGAADTAT